MKFNHVEQADVQSSDDKQNHLKIFESNLQSSVLIQFTNAERDGKWKGNIELKGLFEYWYAMKNGSTAGGMLSLVII